LTAGGHGRRPVSVAELPASLPILRESGEVSGFINPMPWGVNHNLMPGGRHYSEVGGKRIDAYVVAPLQFNVTDGLGELPRALLRGCAIREGHLAIDGHKESGARVEILKPCGRAILGHIMGDGLHEGPHSSIDGGSTVRRQTL